MNFNEKEKIYQEMLKNSPHLLEKYSPVKKLDRKPESPLEKLKNMRKDKLKDISLKSCDPKETKKTLPRVKADDVKLIAYELKLRFILKKIDINNIEQVISAIISLKNSYFSHFLMKILRLEAARRFLKWRTF